MINEQLVIQKGKEVVRIEAEAIAELQSRISESFVHAIDMMLGCSGRIVVTGMGKSGIIARKIVATFNSTETIDVPPSFRCHPRRSRDGPQ